MRFLFVILTLLNIWRFRKTRDRWFLGLAVLFGLMAVRLSLPPHIFYMAAVPAMLWVIWLGVWKFHPKLRMRNMLGDPKLRPLEQEEKLWRKSITTSEKDRLESWEMLTKQRFSHPDAIAFVERHRETEVEDLAKAKSDKAEQEAYFTEERAAEAEKKELMVTPLAEAIEVLEPETGKSLWVKLDSAGDDDDEDLPYSAPVRCKIWQNKPQSTEGSTKSYAILVSVIGFPPDDTVLKPKFWESCSPDFKKMFQSRCLVAGVTTANDGRERFEFRIDEKVFTIMTKYLHWQTDLALDLDQQKIWVRISEMLSEVWLTDAENEGDQEESFEDFARIPAFVYEIPIRQLLPSTHPEAHVVSLDKLNDDDE